MGWNKVALVGVGMIKFGELFEKTYEAMIEEAYMNLISSIDKGFDPKEIEAAWLGTAYGTLFGNEIPGGPALTATIGLAGIPATRIENGCPTGSDAFRNACLGIASGVYEVALVLGAEKMREKSTDEGLLSVGSYGNPLLKLGGTPPSYFAHKANRHMHDFGTTKEHMAMVAVKNHHNGTLDRYAHYQYEITLEDVLRSPMVCVPFNMLDCCPQTDGAAAALICRADLAEKYTDRPVFVAGFGMGTDFEYSYEHESLTEFVATIRAAKQAYKMAGIEPRDIDVAEVHDCFSFTEICNYEDLGFCAKGEGKVMIEKGETTLEGNIPVNPSGGLMAKGHPLGATGIAQIAELFWQLREDRETSNRQAKIRRGFALQHNVGGTGISASVVIILSKL